MVLQDIICAGFANFIHSYNVELSEFKDGKLTVIIREDDSLEFYNELMKVIYEDELDVQVNKIDDNTLELY